MFSTLSHRGDDLGFESEVGDLEVALGDADIALVGAEPKAGQEGLGDMHCRKLELAGPGC